MKRERVEFAIKSRLFDSLVVFLADFTYDKLRIKTRGARLSFSGDNFSHFTEKNFSVAIQVSH